MTSRSEQNLFGKILAFKKHFLIGFTVLLVCQYCIGEHIRRLPDPSLPTKLVLPITTVKPENLVIANMIFEDKFQFTSTLKDVFHFPGGKINYDAPARSSQDSNYLWMQSLTPISHLCNAYEITHNLKYLKRVWPILMDWEAYEKHGKNKFLWYDHSVSNRVHTLIYFYVLAAPQGLLDESQKHHIVELLGKHCAFLADPKNYTQYNHGVMMNKALLLASLFLRSSLPEESQKWLDLSLRRIQQDFERDFTPSMVHIENSVSYHFFVTQHFNDVARLLTHYRLAVPPEIATRLAKAQEYAQRITKPDGTLPLIGDTSNMVSPTTCSLTSGVYDDAGVAIFCNPAKPRRDSTWMLFKSGYLTQTHKHADDLSFLLYCNGEDVFTDAGVLNYQRDDRLGEYIRSALAHNTLVVDHATYPLQARTLQTTAMQHWKLFPQAGLSAHQLSDQVDWATGFNDSYKGVKLKRTLLFVKPDLLVLHDTALSSATHAYSQLFRIAPGMRLTHLEDEGLTLMAKAGKLTVSMAQLLPAESGLFDGDTESSRGYASFSYDNLTPDLQVEFSAHGNKAEFVTVIGINMTPSVLKRRIQERLVVKNGTLTVLAPGGRTLVTLPAAQ